ncbi:MAG TPA: hypothetical protein VJ869_15790 [Sphaerochaeta sp.]|nr:hypothetical protein [Sphaerochaeta sp.]
MGFIANQSLYSGYYKDYLQPILKTLALSLPILLSFDDHKRTALLVGLETPLNLTMLLGIVLGLFSTLFGVGLGIFIVLAICGLLALLVWLPTEG